MKQELHRKAATATEEFNVNMKFCSHHLHTFVWPGTAQGTQPQPLHLCVWAHYGKGCATCPCGPGPTSFSTGRSAAKLCKPCAKQFHL